MIPHQVLAVVPFQQEAGSIAFSLSEGRGFSDVFRLGTGPTAWLPPIYPLVLSGVFRAFGPFTFGSFLAAATLNCLFSAAACVPLLLLGRRLGGISLASLAAWLWAIFPFGILFPTEWMWDTSLSTLLAVWLLLATVRLAGSAFKPRAWVAYGLLWGFALLTNPSLGAALPIFLLWLIFRAQPGTRSWKPAVVAFLTAVLCCLPWTARNYLQFRKVLPLRSNFAFEWWLGNNDIFDPHATNGIQRITRFEQTRLYRQLGETGFMEQKRTQAALFVRTHPALELRLIGRRIVATWIGTESPWRDFLRVDSLPVRGVLLLNAVLLFAAACGVILLFVRHDALAIPLAAFPVAFPVVYYITHTSLRYRHPIDPILLLLSAISLSAAFSRKGKSADRAA